MKFKQRFGEVEITDTEARLIKRFPVIRNVFTLLKPDSTVQDIHLEYPLQVTSRWGFGQLPNPYLLNLIDANSWLYETQLQKSQQYLTNFENFTWRNGWFDGIDVIMLYTMVRETKPKRFIEVGSGITTLIARQAITDGQLNTKILTIDPFPERVPQGVADTFIKDRAENMKHDFWNSIGEDDILFVDNSHYCLQNSDVTVMFTEVLPAIQSGTLIHFHDIFLPYDYPPEFHYRMFSEQYPLAAWLLGGEKFSVELPDMFISLHETLSNYFEPFTQRYQPKGFEPCGASFWIRKK